jgi:hypothetical protein
VTNGIVGQFEVVVKIHELWHWPPFVKRVNSSTETGRSREIGTYFTPAPFAREPHRGRM